MTPEDFHCVVEGQIEQCQGLLKTKGDEYATNRDKLHNFRTAANLQGISMRQALAGMLAKHTVSLYDMCHEPSFGNIDVWNEKITDHINYLLLLKAIVIDEQDQILVRGKANNA